MSFAVRRISLNASRICRLTACRTGRVASSSVRFLSFKAEDQPRLRIGTTAPNFKAVTTDGEIDFHEFIGDSWTILFSHPADFTPVCTTELGAFSALKDEFTKRNTKLIGLSADGLESHKQWVKDIEETSTAGKKFDFPIIADFDRNVSFLYDMVDEEGFKKLNQGIAFTIRNVFIIDPAKKIRLFLVYPASTGRNTAEILRVLDALQLTDRSGLVTPVNWTEGKDVIIPPSISNEDAQAKYGDFKQLKPYLRFTKAPLKSSFIGSPVGIFAGESSSGSNSSRIGMIVGLGLAGGLVFGSSIDKDEWAQFDVLSNVLTR